MSTNKRKEPMLNRVSPECRKNIESIALKCKIEIHENGKMEGHCWQKNNSRKMIKKDEMNSSSDDSSIRVKRIHVKSIDTIAKDAKVCFRKGILHNGHRGDYVKIRNGHGTYIPFNRKEY